MRFFRGTIIISIQYKESIIIFAAVINTVIEIAAFSRTASILLNLSQAPSLKTKVLTDSLENQSLIFGLSPKFKKIR